MCWIVTVLVLIGAINWGLVGLGGFLDMNLNVVQLLVGTWPIVEWIVYILVGIAGLIMAYCLIVKCNNCECMKKDETKTVTVEVKK
jgi:uncharacterized membrane protein YuzA (DUF378 family)